MGITVQAVKGQNSYLTTNNKWTFKTFGAQFYTSHQKIQIMYSKTKPGRYNSNDSIYKSQFIAFVKELE